MTENIFYQKETISKKAREGLIFYTAGGFTIWFTGLSGSGKSTIAREVEQHLYCRGNVSYVLDGDNIRHGLNKDLGFSQTDRKENIRRIAEVSKLINDAGITTLVAFISPYKEDRINAKLIIGEQNFFEVFVKCPIEECENRDPKGLYKKVRNNEIKGFTGIDAPYEEPDSPSLVLDTAAYTIDECVAKVVSLILKEERS